MPSIRLLGPFPPPFGGVALHLVRLLEAYTKRRVDVQGVTLGGAPDALSGVRTLRVGDVFDTSPVHYHTDEGNFKWMLLFSCWWRLLRIPYVVTVHSFRHREEFSSRIMKSRLKRSYDGAKAVIAISAQVKDELISRINVNESRIHVIPSALPLSEWEKHAPLPNGIPDEWLDARIRVIVNAGRLVRYHGKDLYGLDVVASAFKGIQNTDMRCLIVIGEVIDDSLMDELQRQINDTNNIYVVKGLQQILTPVINHAHIVVRATRTEGGESLTLTEALELGRWAVGSDCIARPRGTLLFKNENAEELQHVIMRCADDVRQNRFPAPYISNSTAPDDIIDTVLRYTR